nr:phage recombination protein Bet [Melissococcus plutonius]
MNNEVMEKSVEYEVNGNSVKLTPNMIKQFITKGNADVTDQEAIMFMKLAEQQQLNPFLNEVYLIKFKGKPAQNIVAKEAFMKRAEKHSEYDGLEAGIIVQRGEEIKELPGAVCLPTDNLLGGWARVYRKDRKNPFYVQLDFKEFSKGQATWNQMPKNMVRKTAIVNALREAFPEALGAMYTEDDARLEEVKTAEPIKEKAETTQILENKFKELSENGQTEVGDEQTNESTEPEPTAKQEQLL